MNFFFPKLVSVELSLLCSALCTYTPYDLLPHYHSAQRKRYSTETAMLCVWSDCLTAADRHQCILLLAFLIWRQRSTVTTMTSITTTSYRYWYFRQSAVQSFLSNRKQEVIFNGQRSTIQQAAPSVRRSARFFLGPLLYLLYTAEVEQLILRHDLHIHQYADDSQVYISMPIGDVWVAADNFTACVHEVSDWMRASRLRLHGSGIHILSISLH